jgi:hypothetical protein
MSCPNRIEIREDVYRPCGDEGRMCDECEDGAEALWLRRHGGVAVVRDSLALDRFYREEGEA